MRREKKKLRGERADRRFNFSVCVSVCVYTYGNTTSRGMYLDGAEERERERNGDLCL